MEFAAPEPGAGVEVDNVAADMAVESRSDVVDDVVAQLLVNNVHSSLVTLDLLLPLSLRLRFPAIVPELCGC